MNVSLADGFYKEYSLVVNALLLGIAVIAGSILEGQNSYLEYKWDVEREPSHEVQENWYLYLSQVLPNEPVGFRYISRMFTSMYFELAMMWAAPSFFLGLAAIFCSLKFNHYGYASFCCMVAAVFTFIYFRKLAHTTHETICDARREINTRLAANQSLNSTPKNGAN